MGCFFFRGLNPRSAPYSNPPSLCHTHLYVFVSYFQSHNELMKVRSSKPLRSDCTIVLSLSTMIPQKSGGSLVADLTHNNDSLTLQAYDEAVVFHLTIHWDTAMAVRFTVRTTQGTKCSRLKITAQCTARLLRFGVKGSQLSNCQLDPTDETFAGVWVPRICYY